MQELTNKVMDLSETSGLGIVCGSLLSHGGAKSAAAFHSSLNLNGTLSCARKKTAMKKLMFAAAVAVCATVGLATETGITSATVVGYNTTTTTAKTYNCVGSAFITAGADGTFTLKDYVPTGFNYEFDEYRILKPATCGTETRLVYIYDDQLADVGVTAPGWYDYDNGTFYNNEALSLGTGFLTSFGTKTAISVQNAGQVFGDSPTIDCRGNAYQVVPNPLPRRVQWKEVSITGFSYEFDELRVLKADTCGTEMRIVYIYEDQLKDVGVDAPGWYDYDNGTFLNDEYIEVGDGFLLSSGTKNIQITFPKAIK